MPTRPVRLTLLALTAAVALTGCGEDEPEQGAPEQTAGTVAVVGQDTLTWDAEELNVDAGTITVELTCEGGVNHNFVIAELDEEVVECAPGETQTGTIDLEAGEYEYVCTVPGHESTMRGTLNVN
jgi:plastocyanin